MRARPTPGVPVQALPTAQDISTALLESPCASERPKTPGVPRKRAGRPRFVAPALQESVAWAAAVAVIFWTAGGDFADRPALLGGFFAAWVAAAVIRRRGRTPLTWLAASAVAVALGTLGELRIATLLGAAAVVAGGRGFVAGTLLTAAAACWFPQTDVIAASIGVPAVAARAGTLLLAALAARACGDAKTRTARRTGGRSAPRIWLGTATGALVALAAAASLLPVADDTRLLDRLPERGLAVRSRPLPLTATEQAHLADVDVVKRRYRVPAGAFDLLAVDGRGDRHAVHDPSYCHLGDGWVELDRRMLPMPGGEAAHVAYGRAGERTEAVFWFTDGTSRTASAGRYWWWATRRRLTAGRGRPEPVLVVLQPAGEVPPDWADVLRQFPALAEM